MKITIETIGDNLSVSIKSPEGTSRADIASVMSLALASTVASVIPADAPSAARMKAASSLANMIATAVKQNFWKSLPARLERLPSLPTRRRLSSPS